jgi:iron complex outermembrane receptor protein
MLEIIMDRVRFHRSKSGALKYAVSVLSLVALQQAHAAGAGLEEVVVTAQKKSESLQEAPISIAAFGANELEARGINTLIDLRSSVPSLQIGPHPNSAITARVFIRGVGNNDDQVTQDPSVAIYLDGVYMARSQGLAMEVGDIERIEVLRGPQGALYGRNASGGAVNFITVAPELDKFGFKQEITAGSRDLLRTKTVVNVPVTEQLAAKLTYLRAKQDGFVKNLGSGEDTFGSQDRQAYRVDALWRPSDSIDVRYTYDHSDVGDSPVFIAAAPLYPQFGHRPSHGSPFVNNLHANDVTTEGHSVVANWGITDTLTLKSITAYRKLSNETFQDYNTGVFSPLPILTTYTDATQDQWSQEFQLLGTALDGKLDYVGGLYYFKENAKSYDTTAITGLNTSLRNVDVENIAYAIFGQGTYSPEMFDRKLHITVGGRWSEDERKATLSNGVQASGVASFSPSVDADKNFDNFSPSLIVRYDLTDDIDVYGKVVTGYKTGGYNVRASSPARFSEGFDPETLTSYELGIKSELFARRLRLNVAVFSSDYKDIQINVASDPNNPAISDVLNAGKAEISGVEMDLTALLTDALTLNLNYGYLDTRYTKIKDATGNDISGNFRFINAPRNSYNASLDYQFPSLPIGDLSARVGYSWQEDVYSVASVIPATYIIPSYGLLDARLNLSNVRLGKGDIRFGLWGRNLEDKSYYVFHANGGVPSAIYGEPRSFGIDVTYEL